MNNKLPFILLIFLIISCKKVYEVKDEDGNVIFRKEIINDSIKKNIYYNKEGSIREVSYYKNDYEEVNIIEYYHNGNLYKKGKENYMKKNGWWYTYDSITTKIIGKEYFINNERYTNIILDTTGKCKYYEIKPYLVGYENNDTINISRKDSIPFEFYKAKEQLYLDKILLRVGSFNKENKYEGYVILYNQIEKYLYINDIYHLFKKNGLYHLEIGGMVYSVNEKICCDSIHFDYTSRFIFIKD